MRSVGYYIIKNDYCIVVDSFPRVERMGGAVPFLPLCAFMACTGKVLPLSVNCIIVEQWFLVIKYLIRLESLVVHWPSVAHYYQAFYRNSLQG